MALQLVALSFVLVLVSLLAAEGQKEPDPTVQGAPRETATCRRPQWDWRLWLAPDQDNYKENEEVMLSCPKGFQPSFTRVKCVREVQSTSFGTHVYREVWDGKLSGGGWVRIQSYVACVATCRRPQWDWRLWLAPDQDNYKENEEVMLSCPKGFQPSFTRVKCVREVQSTSFGTHVYREVWDGKLSGGGWVRIQSYVACVATCRRPQWGSRLQLAPDQDNYKENEEVMLSCPEGFQPSFTHIKCVREVQSISYGKPEYREVWHGRDSGGGWVRIRSNVACVEVLQVVPGTLEVSSTSIKLNWTCRLPDACQNMQATCRAMPSSPPCEAEEVKGEEMLHGQEGTFTCPPLQPFTDYSVTISLPLGTILFSWLVRTEGTVPDKPEELWLDPSTGSLRWKALPSCQGEIIGYQLNITTRSTQDGAFLETERLRLSSSVTEHPLPEYGPGSSYAVTMQGLTAAGAGAASLWEFQSNSSHTPHPLDISCRSVRDISPSQGTAVLLLHPIAHPNEAAREHQLIVAATHNGTGVEGACVGEPQPFNASQQPGAYMAAVLNLTTSTDFVLGDGTRGQGYHNAALRLGSDYTALLRLVHRSQQVEKFTCVCYSFSVVAGQPPGSWRGTVIGVVVLLAIFLLSAGILWLVLSRKRKSLPSKAKEDN
ncbi:uncharacterized protein LJ206_001589 isoform 3-T3 [Theristicus caerulescens]